MALPVPASASDIQQYQYPYTPLAAALFRVRGGSFQAKISATARSRSSQMRKRCGVTIRISSDTTWPAPGPATCCSSARMAARMPFHAMIFLGQKPDRAVATNNTSSITPGPTGKLRGEIRRLALAQLLELSRPALAASRRQSRFPRRLSLEHSAGSGVMRLKSAFVAVLLCHTLLLPLFAQDDTDTAQSFSLTSQRTYMPGEKPEISVNSHNVKAAGVPRLSRERSGEVLQPDAGVAQLRRPGAQPAEAGPHVAGESFMPGSIASGHGFAISFAAQFSPESRQKIRLWQMGGGRKETGRKG